jgi:DNA-binding transcriptional LysR family regulator
MSSMSWDDLKVFLAIAEEGGLKKAARRLDIHHSSCARRILALEEALKVKLFERRSAGYVLTQSGESLYRSSANIRGEIFNIERNIHGRDELLEGQLCLTLPNGFATHLLMPDLERFMRSYPNIDLEVNMSYAFRDLSNREADVAIRHVSDPPDSLIGKRVSRIYQCAYASRQYLKKHDPYLSPSECAWLGWGAKERHLKWPLKKRFPEIPVKANMYSDVLQLEAVKAHAGIATLPCYMVDGARGIQRLPGLEPVPGDWVWVLAHKDMATNAKVRILIEYLAEAFAKYQNKMKGQGIGSRV